MPGTSLNPRQERAARIYVQTGIKSEAYRRAGYKCVGEAVYPAANQLFRNKKVKDRVAELEAEAIEASELTKERLLGQGMDILAKAKGQGNLSVAGAMVERLLKATGNWVEKTEDVTKRTDKEVLSDLYQQLEPLVGKDLAQACVDAQKQRLGVNLDKQEGTEQ